LGLGASLLLAGAAYRLSRSLTVAGVVYVLAFYDLRAASGEPAHPGHLLMLLLAAMIATALLMLERRQRLAFAVLGALAAAALLSKVNIGLLAVAALFFASVLSSPRLVRSRALAATVSAAYVLMPVVLMNGHVWHLRYSTYCLHVLLGALGVALVALGTTRRQDPDGGATWWLAYAAGGALGLASIVCGVVIAQ